MRAAFAPIHPRRKATVRKNLDNLRLREDVEADMWSRQSRFIVHRLVKKAVQKAVENAERELKMKQPANEERGSKTKRSRREPEMTE